MARLALLGQHPPPSLSSPISEFENFPSLARARVNKLSLRVVEMLVSDRR